MREYITIVTGCGRCGSTAVMHMLAAGGMPVMADDGASYESEAVTWLPQRSDWLAACQGRALKVLDVHRQRGGYAKAVGQGFLLPVGPRYRFIYMKRDPGQQATSQHKFAQALLGRTPPASIKSLRKSLRADNKHVPAALQRHYPSSRVLTLYFEGLIANPLFNARLLNRFLDGGLDEDAMEAAVTRRSPACLPKLAELDWLDRKFPEGLDVIGTKSCGGGLHGAQRENSEGVSAQNQGDALR